MTDPDQTSVSVSDRDVYFTRAFAAPRDLVWRFFTEADLIASWFGPTGFSTPAASITIEPVVGGRWDLSMVDDATGASFPIRGRITRCRPPEYLEILLDAVTEEGTLDDVVLRLQFHDHGDRTRVTLHQGPFTDVQREQTAGGWKLSFIKLDARLEQAPA